MSQSIVDEIMFLLDSFFFCLVITCVYDSFLILRRLIRHNMLLISLEDLVFWIACAVSVYYVLYEENNGILRWFAVVGACVGMIAYKKTLSPWIVCCCSSSLPRTLIYALQYFKSGVTSTDTTEVIELILGSLISSRKMILNSFCTSVLILIFFILF